MECQVNFNKVSEGAEHYTQLKRKRQALFFFTNTMRRDTLKNIVMTIKINGRRGSSRPREIMLNGL